MAIHIFSNTDSLMVQGNLAKAAMRLDTRMARLSSGLRITSAADDAAGLGLSEHMRAKSRSLHVAMRNMQDGIGLARTADQALGELQGVLDKQRDLAMQAASGIMTDEGFEMLEAELEDNADEITRLVHDAEFNGISILASTGTVAIQVGTDSGDETVDLDLPGASLANLGTGFYPLDLTLESGRTWVFTLVDTFTTEIGRVRGEMGSFENRLRSAYESAFSTMSSLSAAESRIRDADIAEESALMTRDQVIMQAAAAVLGQANVQPQMALHLLL